MITMHIDSIYIWFNLIKEESRIYIVSRNEFLESLSSCDISANEESKKIVSFRITKGNIHDTKKL